MRFGSWLCRSRNSSVATTNSLTFSYIRAQPVTRKEAPLNIKILEEYHARKTTISGLLTSLLEIFLSQQAQIRSERGVIDPKSGPKLHNWALFLKGSEERCGKFTPYSRSYSVKSSRGGSYPHTKTTSQLFTREEGILLYMYSYLAKTCGGSLLIKVIQRLNDEEQKACEEAGLDRVDMRDTRSKYINRCLLRRMNL